MSFFPSTYQEYVVPATATPSAVSRKLQSLGELQAGWGGPHTRPLAQISVKSANMLLGWGATFRFRMNVFPGEYGAVAVAFYRNEDRIEVVVDDDGRMTLHHERKVGPDFEDLHDPLDVTPDAVLAVLSTPDLPPSWKSSESSSLATWTSTPEVFRVPRSRALAGKTLKAPTEWQVYPSSTPIAHAAS